MGVYTIMYRDNIQRCHQCQRISHTKIFNLDVCETCLNDEIRELHAQQPIQAIKEVSKINYQEAYDKGYSVGHRCGHDEGYDECFDFYREDMRD